MSFINFSNMALYGLQASFFTDYLNSFTVSGLGQAGTGPYTSIIWDSIRTDTGPISGVNRTISPVSAGEAGIISLAVTANNFNVIGKQFIAKFDPLKGLPTYIQPGELVGPVEGTVVITTKPTSVVPVITENALEGAKVLTNASSGAVSDTKPIREAKDFFFAPGADNGLSFERTTGYDINTTVTDGISQTDTTGGSSTYSTSIDGTWAGLDLPIGLGGEFTSSWEKSKTVDYSVSVSQTKSNSTTTGVNFDVSKVLPDPNRGDKYYYGNTQLVPGQKYLMVITQDQIDVRAPTVAGIKITGNNITIKGYTSEVPTTNTEYVTTTLNIANALNNAKNYSYGLLSNVNENFPPSDWTFQREPDTILTKLQGFTNFRGWGDYKTRVEAIVTGADVQKLQSIGTKVVIDLQTLDDKLHSDGIALELANDSILPSNYVAVAGSKNGGDTVELGNQNYYLSGFKDSYISLGNGDSTVNNQDGGGHNFIKLENGFNTISVAGDLNAIQTGLGTSVIKVYGSGHTAITNGGGTEVVLLTSTTQHVVVENWDFHKDVIQFGKNIPISQVSLTYDQPTQEYHVYVAGNEVAVLLADPNNLPVFDAITRKYTGTSLAPIAMSVADNTTFISSVLASAFEIATNAAGTSYWDKMLQNGTTRGQFIVAVFTSAEFNAAHSNPQDYVNTVYQDMLGRQADASNLAYWTGQLANGVSEATFVDSLLHSPEFVSLVGNSQAAPAATIAG